MDNMDQVLLAWSGLHNGEEPPLVPAGGLFFSGCNLKCVFCQNYQISQAGLGKPCGVSELAEKMLALQAEGAADIDLVTPTIWAPVIKEALIRAKEQGLSLPVVWNSNAYEDVGMLRSLEDLIDIYLPDYKYSDAALGRKYSGIEDYPDIADAAIREMRRQVGRLEVDAAGRARRGLIVRHLVLPGNLENSFGVLERIAAISPDIYVSLMNQYAPLYGASRFPEIDRQVSADEFDQVREYLKAVGLGDGWIQGAGSQDVFVPDFTKEKPF